MANRFFNPNEQFCDATGTPYAGGSLTFYASGTTTPLNTYSNQALSIANTNPVVLDSAGRAGTVFLQNLAYKVVLADVNNNVIWTMDPVYASDFSTLAQFQSGNGSPNGSVAGSAGSPTIPASVYWDATNNILYVCTQTGTTSTAVWTAINAGAATAVVPAPQGYLTPTSGTPIIASDVISATSLFYTPCVGNLVPIYNGTSFVPTVFSELTLLLTASHAASTLYDVFIFSNSGVLTLVTGPAWSNSTAGSCARGTGATTTQISRLNGFWVNTVSMTGRNGANTYTIPANQATYLGTLFIDSAAGQITLHRSYGQSRKWAIWNAYNRANLYLKAGDPTASWTYNSSTVRASNNNSANSLSIFSGLAEEFFDLRFLQLCTFNGNATSSTNFGSLIGVNSTTTASGFAPIYANNITVSGTTYAPYNVNPSEYFMPPSLGINTINALETGSASLTPTFLGTETKMLLSASWRG